MYRLGLPRHPLLQPNIQCFWYIEQKAEEAASVHPRMLPDGGYHWVVNLGDPHHYFDSGGRRISPERSHINAMQSEPAIIRRTGRVEMIGVVFRPYGLVPFIPCPVNELVGDVRNIRDVLDARVFELEDRLASAATIAEKFAAMESGLLQWMREDARAKPEVVRAVDLLTAAGGSISVHGLARTLGMSERTLERHFLTHTGLSPKSFAVIQRIDRVLRLMRQPSDAAKLLDYAAAGEFYDQSHFNRMFKRFVGATPQSYLQTRDSLSDLYNTNRGEFDTL